MAADLNELCPTSTDDTYSSCLNKTLSTGTFDTLEEMIPVIELEDESQESADKLVQAAIEWGFLYVSPKTCGIAAEDIKRMFEVSRLLFSQPHEEKLKYAISPSNRGYSSFDTELLDPSKPNLDDKEGYNFGEYHEEETNVPDAIKPLMPFLKQFSKDADNLCQRILRLLSKGLHIRDGEVKGEDFLTDRHDRTKGRSGSILRLLHYPANSSPATDGQKRIRAGAHSDYGSITLLFREGEEESGNGLEILKTNNEWEPVKVYPNDMGSNIYVAPILVNLGDLLSYWTAGLLRSTVHRVTSASSQTDRYSIAYFCHPVDSSVLDPIPSELVEEKAKRDGISDENRAVTAMEHLAGRLQATYRWKENNNTKN